jgi:hypothetical protein
MVFISGGTDNRKLEEINLELKEAMIKFHKDSEK